MNEHCDSYELMNHMEWEDDPIGAFRKLLASQANYATLGACQHKSAERFDDLMAIFDRASRAGAALDAAHPDPETATNEEVAYHIQANTEEADRRVRDLLRFIFKYLLD